MSLEDLDNHGRALLAELAADPESECWREFDALYYQPVWSYLCLRHDQLAARVARYLSAEGVMTADVLPEEVAEAAHMATQTAMRRVRENAQNFDPTRGTPTRWVIGAAEFAYVEVAKELIKARRSDTLRFMAPEDLPDEIDPSPTTEEHVIRQMSDRDDLAAAAEHLSEREFTALRLRVLGGLSRAEAARRMFGDDSMTRQVDGLLERGKRKLRAAWEDRRRPPRAASGTNVYEHGDDKE